MSIPIPDQVIEIEDKLRVAWGFLTGEDRCFRFVEDMTQHEGAPIDRRIVLPISLPNAKHQSAIALLIGREDAEQLASSMFGVLKTDLAEADIADACAEACNVLSGAIVEYMSTTEQIEIGLPTAIEAAGYQSVLLGSNIKAFFEGKSDKQHLTLVIFDPLVEPRPQGGV
ncbi:MAG: chemotaxis protein CheX [Betaproteobacteria bacterium]